MPTVSGIAFTELPGSGRFSGDERGTTCVRKFNVAQANWPGLLELLIGKYSITAGKVTYTNPQIPHPGYDGLFVSSWQAYPLVDESPTGNQSTDLLKDEALAYSVTGGLYSHVLEVKYSQEYPISPNDAHPDLSSSLLSNCPGTYITYERDFGGEVQLSSGSTWLWNNGTKVQADIPVGQVIPTANHVITWFWVAFPPYTNIRQSLGKVNSSTFLGAPAETVMLTGATPTPMFRFQRTGPPLFKITYRFSEQSKFLADGTTTVGWNHQFNPTRVSGENWQKIKTADGDNPFKTYDFATNLFKYSYQ